MPDEPFISYAQHGEDVVLWRALGDRQGVFYVDVGAYDPSEDSVTKALYQRGWRGVNIEAQPDRIAAFEQERPDELNLALAIGDRDGTITLTLGEKPGWASTVDSSVLGGGPGWSKSIDVPLRRLDTLLPELGITHVDVLKIDVEGAEPSVVRGLLGSDVMPLVCVVEGVAPTIGRRAGDEAVALLVEAGYTHCMFDGLNHYLTTQDDLVERLSVPAHPMDLFVTDPVHRLMAENEHLQRTVVLLAGDNTSLRAQLAPPAVEPAPEPPEAMRRPGTWPGRTATRSDADMAPTGSAAAVESPPAPSDTDVAEGAGDLPLPVDPELPGDEAGLAVATADVPGRGHTGPFGLPVAAPSLVPAETRRARRRRTLTRLLADVVPSLPSGTAVSDPRLDPAELALMTPAEAVDALYRVVFGRTADPAGLAAWTGQLETGASLLAVARALAASEEAAVQPAERRASIAEDLREWTTSAALEELGVSVRGVTDAYEPGTIAYTVFVEALYEAAHQRRPTEDELRFEVRKLSEGAGREWLLRAFAGRSEARARVLGGSGGGLRASVRRWRNRRRYVETFRSLVAEAESRQVACLLHQLSPAGRAHGAGVTAGPSKER